MIQLANTTTQTIIYEQPLNEVIRVCLRLEQLFEQINHHLTDQTILGTRQIISFIINVLQLLDRPDLKAKLAKELSHHLANLMRYDNMPEIDAEKLNQITTQLEYLSRHLIDSSGKIGQRLRDIELLNTLRTHLASPGGGCSFDIPLFHYWLQQPFNIRQATITDWLGDFSQIKTATNIVLDLVRKSAKIDQKQAVHGFHQELLDPQSNLRMIRITMEKNISAYPEISVGRHFLSIRFFSPNIQNHPQQFTESISFWIGYCNS
jgi:cell division protein ZapD